MASPLSKELLFLILQFLDEENCKESVHKLEKESGLYFNMKYFEEILRNGEWDEVESYLSGFTKFNDNRNSMKIFFVVRKQKYLEALDRNDCAKAVEILRKDLKVIAACHEELYKEMTQLLTLDNIRENAQLSNYVDANSAREIILKELKQLIEANPLLREKLQFPAIRRSRLRTLINQSLNWQHQLCKNPKRNPDIQTLYMDHSCGVHAPHGAKAPSPTTDTLMGSVPTGPSFHQIATPPFHPTFARLPASPPRWMTNFTPVSHPSTPVGHMRVAAPNNQVPSTSDPSAMLKRPMTQTYNPAMSYSPSESDHISKKPRAFGTSAEASNMAVTVVPGGQDRKSHTHVYSPISNNDLPNKVIMTLNQGSAVKCMDFHPVQQFLLLVGTSTGEITIWNISTRKSLVVRKFEVWHTSICSLALQEFLATDYTTVANCVKWSPDGLFFGAAFSEHIVHIYSYQGNDLRNHLEIEAHEGSVNDIAFAYPNKTLSFVTCGDDKFIKVWDAHTGSKLFTFEGHEAPVFSVCPHEKENVSFIFSTSTDGKIKAWLYDDLGSRVDYDAPGLSSTMMAYSGDGRRLFTCGTNKEGVTHLVEWDESEGVVKRAYLGLGKQSVGTVIFDTTKNQFLAAGDESVIKFWDMDGEYLLAITDADGGLPASPCLKFNNEGLLLAVSTEDNGIKILANGDGISLLGFQNFMADTSSYASVAAAAAKTPNVGIYGSGVSSGESVVPVMASVNMINDDRSVDGSTRPTNELGGKSRAWKLTLVNEPSKCRSVRLPDNFSNIRIASLKYTNFGGAILALTCNGVHKVWKWPGDEKNVNGKATASTVPLPIYPLNGISMINDISVMNPEEAISCFALSNNDSYILSASGGNISLFNLPKLQTLTQFMPPPPAATYLAFYPEDNNIVAIGRDDSSIIIYNMRVTEVKTKLDGHHKRITGLAFSPTLRVLVSAGADSQLCVWNYDGWEKLESKNLQMPHGRLATPLGNTCVQFHVDQVHVLVIHETQIAIYNARKLECLKQWVLREVCGSITYATYSCDSQLIYVSFQDGSVDVLSSSSLRLKCRINPESYLAANPTNPIPYPVVIAAHPSEPNQFALGLTDGGVVVLEPNESEGQWGTTPTEKNGARSSSSSPLKVDSSDQRPSSN